MAVKCTIVSTKGGTGKTTVCANLAGFLADHGQRILMIDADPQPTLSSYYPIKQKSANGFVQLLATNPNELNFESVISQTEIDGLDLIYSNDPKNELYTWMLHTPDGRTRLKWTLNHLDDEYDIILIDTQGANGPIQDAAVLAADFLVSPILPEMLAATEFIRGTVEMLSNLQPMEALNCPIGQLYGVINKLDNTRDARSIVQSLRGKTFLPSKGKISILDNVIPPSVIYREAATMQIPVHRHEKRRGYDVMFSLASELFPHIVEESGNSGSTKHSAEITSIGAH